MKKRSMMARLASLMLALILAVSLIPAASAASATSGMGNFKEVKSAPHFSDVSDADYNDVRVAYQYGIMEGKSSTIFDPTGNIKICEALTMACRVYFIYLGYTFEMDTSRNPWYSDAVDWAIELNLIKEGQYKDYNAYATRADLADLFYCLPTEEFPRINRISWISDVSPHEEYNIDYIYFLYNAGVLTGVSESGAFMPDAYIKRVDATRIVNRVILQENRKHVSVTTMALGEVTTGANGNFRLSIPKNSGWETLENAVDEDGWCSFRCRKVGKDGTVLLSVLALPKASYKSDTLYTFSREILEAHDLDIDVENWEGGSSLFRGLSGYRGNTDSDGVSWRIRTFENSTQFYAVVWAFTENCGQALYDELLTLAYTLDIAQ